MNNLETRIETRTPPLVGVSALPDSPGKKTVKVAHTATVSREDRTTVGELRLTGPRIRCTDVNVYYGDKRAIRNINLDIGRNEVIALIGPSGCGKTTFLRCLNRMNDTIEGCRVTGDILMDEININEPRIDVVPLRAQVGMVFQKPNPFPKSIWENIAFGPRTGPARYRPVRGAAAASVHRPHHRRRPGGDTDGRALFGAGPHRHCAHRGPD